MEMRLQYHVYDCVGTLVLETSRATEAYIKARKVGGIVTPKCYECGGAWLTGHECLL